MRCDFAAVDDAILGGAEVRLQRLEFEKILVDDCQILWLQSHHLMPIIQVELHWHRKLNMTAGTFAAMKEEFLVLLLM